MALTLFLWYKNGKNMWYFMLSKFQIDAIIKKSKKEKMGIVIIFQTDSRCKIVIK